MVAVIVVIGRPGIVASRISIHISVVTAGHKGVRAIAILAVAIEVVGVSTGLGGKRQTKRSSEKQSSKKRLEHVGRGTGGSLWLRTSGP